MSIEPVLILGLLLTVLVPQAYAGGGRAFELVRESLEAPITPYEGELRVSTFEGGAARSRVLSVRFAPPSSFRRELVDESGHPLWTLVSDGRDQWVYDRRRRAAYRSEPPGAGFKLIDPEEEFRLIVSNYSFRLAGRVRVADRDCSLVEVLSRSEGRLVQTLAVEEEYGVVLERKTFGPGGETVSEQRFLRVDLPARSDGWDFGFRPPPGAKVLSRPQEPDFLGSDEVSEAAERRALLPSWLPPGYVFESADLLPCRGAPVFHLRFTDGIDVLSLFQFPPGARLGSGGRHPAVAGGPRVRGAAASLYLLPEGKLLEWGSGERFALLGPLPTETLRRVAESVGEPAGRQL